jgi:hypothetical protein
MPGKLEQLVFVKALARCRLEFRPTLRSTITGIWPDQIHHSWETNLSVVDIFWLGKFLNRDTKELAGAGYGVDARRDS